MPSPIVSEPPVTREKPQPELAYRLRQQTLLAEFGLYAVPTADVDALLQRAAELCAQGMNAEFAKVLEWRPQQERLLVRAGVGWADGVVGTATLGADLESPAGFALHTGRPVISNHLARETRFRTPQLLLDHGVKRAINVIVRGHEKGPPFGVLAVDSPAEGRFDEADIAFMQGFANLLGVAIERIRAEAEHRRTEVALRESEERTRLIIASVRDYAIFTLDIEGRITSWNAGAAAVFGWSESEIVGQPVAVLFTPEDRDAGVPERELARAFAEGRAVDERWLVRKDGQRFFGSESVRPLHDRAGRVRGEVKVARDETERRRAEEALRQSEQSFRTLANSIPQLAWMADAQGWIFWFNERWFAYTGTTLEEMVGWGWRKCHHPDHVDRVVERIQHSWETGEPWEDTFPLRGQDGKYRWFLSRALPIREAQGRIVRWFGTNTDVTEQREAEERQALLMREISHRVKNSLALVAGLLGLQARAAEHEDVRCALKDAETRVGTIARVHDHLWQHRDVTTIDLTEFLARLCAGLQETAPRHRLIYEAAGAVPISTDRAIPVGLLVNELVTNAFKYAYPAETGGEVRVALSRAEPGRVRLEVADHGEGLPPDFDLQQPDGSLGLRLIDAFTRQLGASLQALPAEPGARFVLDMPEEA